MPLKHINRRLQPPHGDPGFEETKSKPEKSLTPALKKSGGRNSQGRITTRFRGGGASAPTA